MSSFYAMIRYAVVEELVRLGAAIHVLWINLSSVQACRIGEGKVSCQLTLGQSLPYNPSPKR